MLSRTVIFLLFVSLKAAAQNGPKITVVTKAVDPVQAQRTLYPWKKYITATVFWVGERPTGNNPTPNNKSSWDQNWMENYGGYDNPDPAARKGYIPAAFTPKQNPFYVALPYNDCLNHANHKPEAARVIPWWNRHLPDPGDTVCKGRWIQIYSSETKKICYAQWEDCGPWVTDDWEYVFGQKPPKNRMNKGAGIDISPAVRDFLGIGNRATVHWRFTEFSRVPSQGPWAKWGDNNPFVNKELNPDVAERSRYFQLLREGRISPSRR
ncbi:hypothetical protein V2O64_06315 [Verrucomicrobiaceae bacterium 227]